MLVNLVRPLSLLPSFLPQIGAKLLIRLGPGKSYLATYPAGEKNGFLTR
jgi:hypothetical protein